MSMVSEALRNEETRGGARRTVAAVVNSVETLEGGGFLVRRDAEVTNQGHGEGEHAQPRDAEGSQASSFQRPAAARASSSGV